MKKWMLLFACSFFANTVLAQVTVDRNIVDVWGIRMVQQSLNNDPSIRNAGYSVVNIGYTYNTIVNWIDNRTNTGGFDVRYVSMTFKTQTGNEISGYILVDLHRTTTPSGVDIDLMYFQKTNFNDSIIIQALQGITGNCRITASSNSCSGVQH